MSQSVFFKQAMRGAQIKGKESSTAHPKEATFQQVKEAIRKANTRNRKDLAMVVLLAWLTAARVGCIMQLKLEDISLAGAKMSITFRRGKGVRLRGPYTVHTTLPREYRDIYTEYTIMNPKEFLFKTDSITERIKRGVEVKDLLREVDKQLEQRSLRRGALQQLANKGASEELLMRFSGHQRVETLRRYLGWGKMERVAAGQMTEVAEKLFE